jgi:hypothetical protein
MIGTLNIIPHNVIIVVETYTIGKQPVFL